MQYIPKDGPASKNKPEQKMPVRHRGIIRIFTKSELEMYARDIKKTAHN